MTNLLLAPNSFKECSDSVEISSLFKKYLTDTKLNIIEKPISDGGDGFLEVCKLKFSTKTLSYEIINTYKDELTAVPVEYSENRKLLFIESAKVLGLNMIPMKKRNPLKLNSRSLGDLLEKISSDAKKGKLIADKVYIGIGGTATTDFGLGACSQFGLKLLNNDNELDIIPDNYTKAVKLEWNKADLPFKLIAIIDVNNKLLGKNGAVFKFAEQKGASKNDLPLLEDGFKNILRLCNENGLKKSDENLSGAGGGLAAGLSIFLNAEIRTSKYFVLEDLGLEKIKNDFDYVLTGEGSFDSQSLMDKGAGIIINTFKDNSKKVFLCCGKISDDVRKNLDKNVYCIELSKYFSSIEESIKNFEKGIRFACEEIIRVVNS